MQFWPPHAPTSWGWGARYPRSRVLPIAIGLGLAAIMHGSYNALASGWPGTIMAAFIVFVVTGYVRSGDQIAHVVDASLRIRKKITLA